MALALREQPNLKRQGEGSEFEEELNRLEKKRQGRRSQFEEELNLPEKKRSQLEEEWKRVVEEGYHGDLEDADFEECDSDAEPDDFTTSRKTIETCLWRDESFVPVDDTQCRNCDKVTLCDKFRQKSMFRAAPIFELYKVKLILNKEHSSKVSGKLYGVIYTDRTPEIPDPVYYFRVTKENAVSITLSPDNNIFNLTLSDPKTLSGSKASPPLACCYAVDVKFAFKFENSDGTVIDLFEEDGILDGPNRYGTDRTLHFVINRDLIGCLTSGPIKMAAYYGLYEGAWATVDVRILKEGVSRIYGFIYARSCIFFSRTRLLSLQSNEMCELQEPNKSIELTRSIAVVPLFSSLVIAALIYDQDGNEIVYDKTFFPASENGSDSKSIGNGNAEIRVKWACGPLC